MNTLIQQNWKTWRPSWKHSSQGMATCSNQRNMICVKCSVPITVPEADDHGLKERGGGEGWSSHVEDWNLIEKRTQKPSSKDEFTVASRWELECVPTTNSSRLVRTDGRIRIVKTTLMRQSNLFAPPLLSTQLGEVGSSILAIHCLRRDL